MLRPNRRESVALRPLCGGALAQKSPVGERKSTRGTAFTHLFAASVESEYRKVAERHTGFV